MTGKQDFEHGKGIGFALLAALLFGASTPLAKTLLPQVATVLMAGLLYLGSGVALRAYREALTMSVGAAAVLMGVGGWLHLTERHKHDHRHEPIEHEHLHSHDAHHQHVHDRTAAPGEPHLNWHRHGDLIHGHPHFPDIHHRRRH